MHFPTPDLMHGHFFRRHQAALEETYAEAIQEVLDDEAALEELHQQEALAAQQQQDALEEAMIQADMLSQQAAEAVAANERPSTATVNERLLEAWQC